MGMLYVTIGCSGSGKTYLGKKLAEKYAEACNDGGLEIVCPDDVQKELTGNISDQTRNAEVFEIVRKRIIDFLNAGKDVYFSATNINASSREFLGKIREVLGCKMLFIVMKDSFDEEKCRNRVAWDIKYKVDRSNTLVESNGEDVIHRQYMQFINLFALVDDEVVVLNPIEELQANKIMDSGMIVYDGTNENNIFITSYIMKGTKLSDEVIKFC